MHLTVAHLEQIRQAAARARLLAFIRYTMPTYKAGWFHEHVCRKLDQFLADVVARRSPRLMLMAPPRHGKTEIVSRRFPAYAFGRYPDLSMIATSYSGELSSRNNRDVQRIMDEEAYQTLFPDSRLWGSNVRTVAQNTYLRNSDLFEIVNHKGVYRSAGVCGGITGMGGDILLIDDPVKDAIEAESETYRQRVWEWYCSTLYTRAAPGGGILLIMTRWHEDDLAGRLLKAQDDGGDKWEVVRYPAIAEQTEQHRAEGDALHPERYNVDALARIRAAVGARVWASLYQQRPSAQDGVIFKRAFWQYQRLPELSPAELVKALGITRVVQAWDTGFKEKTQNDPSVGVTLGVTQNRYIVLDVWRGRVEYPDLKRVVQAQHAKWNPSVVLIEDAASGQSLIQELRRTTRIPIVPVKPDRDKVARANSVTPQLEAGLVSLPEGATWLADFVDELSAFPLGAHDDQVDAFTIALGYVAGGGGKTGMLEFYREQAEQAKMAAAQPDPRAQTGGVG